MIRVLKTIAGYKPGSRAWIIAVDRSDEIRYAVWNRDAGCIAWLYPWNGECSI